MGKRGLFIVPSYYPADQSSGTNHSLHLLTKTLVAKGSDITVYTTNYDVDLKPNICHDIDGVKVFYFETLGRGYIGEVSPKMYKMLKQNIRLFDWVYIMPVWNPVLWYSMRLASKTKTPFIISPRGTLYPEVVGRRNFFVKKLCFSIIRPYLEKAACFHYTTEDEKEKVENYWNLKPPALVVPNGIKLEDFRDLPPAGFFKNKFKINGPYILHLGRINWVKGLNITAVAFKKLLKTHSDLQWVIAGSDDGYKSDLLRQLKALGCENQVRFVGLLLGVDKLGAFISADAFILSSYSENFGMAVVEAMACGTPVVISDKVGIHKEVREHRAGIVVRPDAESVYNGIKTILDNTNLAQELSINGKELVENQYNIDKVADMMIKVYEEILQ